MLTLSPRLFPSALRAAFLAGSSAILLCHAHAQTQQLPPIEPPKSQTADQQTTEPTIRVTTKEVLVPTLVEKGDGEVIYGLKENDFVLEDNGVPQKIRVQEE